jgi:type II secretory pathway component PulJ
VSARAAVREAGISLVELLLGLAITALVMAPLVPMLQTASAAASIAGNQVALEREADFALERIAARIRATAPTKALTDKPSAEWLKPAVYSVSNGTLIERQGNETYVLAESVTALGLTVTAAESAQPLLTVSLTLTNGGASTMATRTVRMGTEQ